MPKYNQARDNRNDFVVDVSRGNIVGAGALVIAGANPDIDTGSEDDLWPQGGSLTYLASEETMDLVSTDAGDTGPLAMFIVGVDNNYAEVSEVIALDGLTPVTTTQAFFRINFMFLSGTAAVI